MTTFSRWAAAGVLFACLTALAPAPVSAQSPDTGACEEMVARMEATSKRLSGDLRQIKREIAALRADLDKPGIGDVFSGIGYILGLFGVAAFVAARRKE